MTIRTIDQIIDRARSVLEAENSELATFPEFGNLYAIYRSMATLVAEQDSKIDSLDDSLFLSTATGDSLEQKAAEFGVSRRLGETARGDVIVVGRNTTIPINTILTNPTTNFQYRTLARVTSRSNRAVVSVESLQRSEQANLAAGSILRSSLFPAVQFTVGSSFNPILNVYEGNITGGDSRETDIVLRSRTEATIRSIATGNRLALRETAVNTGGVSRVTVSENEPSLGFVTVYVDTRNQDVIRNLKIRLDRAKPIGTSIIIKSYQIINIDVVLSVTVRSTEDTQTLIQDIQSLLAAYINNLSTGELLTKESIAGTVLQNTRVTNVEVITPTANEELGASQLFALRDLQIRFRT